MSICVDCKHATWARTKSGALHPSGNGWCEKEVLVPPAPAAFQWFPKPQLLGGSINRKGARPDHCHYFDKKEA